MERRRPRSDSAASVTTGNVGADGDVVKYRAKANAGGVKSIRNGSGRTVAGEISLDVIADNRFNMSVGDFHRL